MKIKATVVKFRASPEGIILQKLESLEYLKSYRHYKSNLKIIWSVSRPSKGLRKLSNYETKL